MAGWVCSAPLGRPGLAAVPAGLPGGNRHVLPTCSASAQLLRCAPRQLPACLLACGLSGRLCITEILPCKLLAMAAMLHPRPARAPFTRSNAAAGTEQTGAELPPLEGLEQTFAGGIEDRDDQGGLVEWQLVSLVRLGLDASAKIGTARTRWLEAVTAAGAGVGGRDDQPPALKL